MNKQREVASPPSWPSVRTVESRNYVNPKVYRGEPRIAHIWLVKVDGVRTADKEIECNPLTCAMCLRDIAQACVD